MSASSLMIDTSVQNRERILKEFRASAIPDLLTEINVQWIEGEDAVAALTENAIAQLQRVNSYVTQPVRRILDDYETVAAGGWLAYGCDPEGLSRGEVAYLKPVRPRIKFDKGRLKPVKYETEKGAAALPIQPWVDDESAAKIYEKYGVAPLEGETFWRVVWRCNLPIAFVEGLKKALSLIAHGIPAIALRGVNCWHKKGSSELHPAIAHFATPGRETSIIFDQDEKPSTQRDVRIQALKFGDALEQLGCIVRIPAWDRNAGKGIDDVLYKAGDGAKFWLDNLLKTAPSLKTYRRYGRVAEAVEAIERLNALNYPVERATEGEYLPPLPPLQRGAIHAVNADMYSGKTYRIGRDYVKPAITAGWNVLVLAPLNSLGQQTAQDLGLPHIHDFGTSALEQQGLWSTVSALHGLVCCPDSLHRIPDWFFDRPLLLVLDEANQVTEHLSEGNTLGTHWAPILELFTKRTTHAATTGAIVLSEDGIPDRAVDFMKSTSGCETVRVFTHTKKGAPWDCNVFSGQASGYRAKFIQAGGRKLFVTSSQREAKRMERVLGRIAPGIKVVRIDSETNQQGQFRDFFQSPDTWLEANQPDVLILSPSAKSGVSIQGGVPVEDAYFKSVWGYFPTLATDAHMQLLGRYRPSVPRFIFVPDFIQSGGDESLMRPEAVKKRLKKNAAEIAGVYGVEELLDAPNNRAELMVRIETAVLQYLAVSRAVAGCQKSIANTALVQRLQKAGHNVTLEKLGKDLEAVELWKEVQEEIWREEAQAIAGTQLDPDVHTPEWARKALDSLECTYEKRITAHKVLWRAEFPGVMFDDPEEAYDALCYQYGAMRRGVLLQAKAENLEAAKETERESAETILSGGVRALHRLPKQRIKAKLIAETGVLALLDGTPYTNQDPRAIAVKQKALHSAGDIKYWLGLQIRPEQTPVEIAHKLLKRLEIGRGKGERPGEIRQIARPGRRGVRREKVYQIDLAANPTRARLLEAARRKLSESVSPISINKETIRLQIEDTPLKNTNSPPLREGAGAVTEAAPPPSIMVGALVTRAGSIGKWLVEAIAGQTAKVKQLGGWGFGTFPLAELELLEAV